MEPGPAGNDLSTATDRWKAKHNGDDQGAFAIRDRKNTGKHYQRKQTGHNKFAALQFLDERRSNEKETQRN